MQRIIALALGLLLAGSLRADPLISEVRIDQPGPDRDEFFELSGQPGSSLDGLVYLVVGDGDDAAGCGVIEELVRLDGQRLDDQGLFCVAEPLAGGYVHLRRELNFENNDSVSHLLVRGARVALGDDLDRDDDGRLDRTPWDRLVDAIALREGVAASCSGDEHVYAATSLAPERGFVAGHAYRCQGRWYSGEFDWPGLSTPGLPNTCASTDDASDIESLPTTR